VYTDKGVGEVQNSMKLTTIVAVDRVSEDREPRVGTKSGRARGEGRK
jgi:hypothetical protein